MDEKFIIVYLWNDLSLQKLNSPTLSVNSEGFIPMLSKLDDCIEYVSSHVSSLTLCQKSLISIKTTKSKSIACD